MSTPDWNKVESEEFYRQWMEAAECDPNWFDDMYTMDFEPYDDICDCVYCVDVSSKMTKPDGKESFYDIREKKDSGKCHRSRTHRHG